MIQMSRAARTIIIATMPVIFDLNQERFFGGVLLVTCCDFVIVRFFVTDCSITTVDVEVVFGGVSVPALAGSLAAVATTRAGSPIGTCGDSPFNGGCSSGELFMICSPLL